MDVAPVEEAEIEADQADFAAAVVAELREKALRGYLVAQIVMPLSHLVCHCCWSY